MLAARNGSSTLMAFWRSLVIRVPPWRRGKKKSSVEGIAPEQRCFMRWTAVPLDFIASSHNGVFVAGSHEGRKANPALDLKLIDCGERPRCEPVSASCRSCKLFLFTVCRQFTVWLWFSDFIEHCRTHILYTVSGKEIIHQPKQFNGSVMAEWVTNCKL